MKKAFLLIVTSLALHSQAFGVGPIVIAGTGNPAAKLCDKLGGTLISVSTASSQTTLCAIDGALVEQWTLFWALKNKTPQQAIDALLNSSDCKSSGGAITKAKESEQGYSLQLCEFSDSSVIAVTTLNGGTQERGNELLIQLLLQAQ
ncbi:DUF333 domain-containing protein [Bdellovibrio sp. GT3]|uniref:DUF333 domain-containing protein n=1 Tax=Bdellovibrio sp. GT3 TaxID=3136282 RepID=UPI0030F1EA9D